MYILAENLDLGNLFWLIFVVIVIISQLASAKKRKQTLPKTQKQLNATSSSDETDDSLTGILYPDEVVETSQPILEAEKMDVKQLPQIQHQRPVSTRVVELPRVVSTLDNIPPLTEVEHKKKQPVASRVIVPTVKLSGSKLVLDLSDMGSLRNAIIAREILGPPLALRDVRSSPPYSPYS